MTCISLILLHKHGLLTYNSHFTVKKLKGRVCIFNNFLAKKAFDLRFFANDLEVY